MLFNSFEFLIFFPVVVIVYLLLPRRIKPVWLLISSYFFYMCWNASYLFLILLTTVITYLTALLLEKARARKLVAGFGISINLLILFLFKYFDFFIDNINKIFGLFGFDPINTPFDFLLPVGISFYTFQAIGYVIDVYRHETPAERNIINYALFVSFFPQLVAGPIERSKNLLSQIKEIRNRNLFNPNDALCGFWLMLWGMFIKVVIADRASVFVDSVFNDYMLCGFTELFLAAVLFAVQIYADFSGYSLIAIGSARVMGIRICENFNTPYFATSIADFWDRWHISLSTWFRDYLYIPLGGNRKGKLRKYLNILIVFTVSGLWHGASWSYVFWGFLHGIYRIFGEVTGSIRDRICNLLRIDTSVFSFRLYKRAITFLLVTFAWIFFRAHSFKLALDYIKRMFTHYNTWVLFDGSIFDHGLGRGEFEILILTLILFAFVSMLKHKYHEGLSEMLIRQNILFRWILFIGLSVIILVYGQYGIEFSSSKFIYFDF